MPASPTLVQGFLWELLVHWYRPGSITLFIYAITDKHNQQQAYFPF